MVAVVGAVVALGLSLNGDHSSVITQRCHGEVRRRRMPQRSPSLRRWNPCRADYFAEENCPISLPNEFSVFVFTRMLSPARSP